MLVLARKKDESIMIGDNIEVVVLGIDGDMVRLGIKASRDIQVYRKEIYASIKQANQEASTSSINIHALNELLGKPKNQ
ncbi:carbon storage regulator CsrA [Paenibacillus cremeus]|uniref:Translational regulator CsrA n=1 Tax=Paenibacillus cremeus TaxID=2163881 RepID=A0A559KB30_9BACL|nr:carbon storage regulator CsrA [Paenibacillus cremeus]TVY09336.1 carbon storage regulator CsrA [Paenibacillus cremeus]